ncbi:MAG: heptosyltransferase [Geobacteraceae bacterium]|nr:MAG: heptosyltransferase [Geobacteraceae bacterium]
MNSGNSASATAYLVIGFGGKGVGDVVACTAFIRNLARNEPDSVIDFVVFSPVGVELLRQNPYVRNTYLLDMDYLRMGGRYSWREKLGYLRPFRRVRYDGCYVLSTKLRHALFAFLTGARERIGYANYHRGFLLTKTGREPLEKNVAERFLDLLGLDGKPIFDNHGEVFLSDREIAGAHRILQEHGVSADDVVVALAPFAADMRRTWGIDNFWEVARHFAGQGYKVLILGASHDREKIESNPVPNAPEIVDLIGRLTILETAAAIRYSAVFLGNDSGLGHIAGAVGAKALVLGYEVTRVWYPIAPTVTTIIKDTGCNGCNVQKCVGNSGAAPVCFSSIKADEVVRTLTEILA